ncbi:MAG: insulinase family protein [Planctomycetes bacterium]|nr:insulinase family protein [Planctomycetota bacterium]
MRGLAWSRRYPGALGARPKTQRAPWPLRGSRPRRCGSSESCCAYASSPRLADATSEHPQGSPGIGRCSYPAPRPRLRMSTRCSGLLLLGLLFAPRFAAQELAATRAWEHEHSDLAVDPRLHFGHFANGVRWVWAKNGEPKFRSYLRLHVNAGSLGEEDSERGMAHFLEHMAFNGSEHFPAGTLVEWFQRQGMSFGADLNAHTDFGETVYELDLPNSDAARLDEGLGVLRDFAFGLTLAEEEIDKEKAVIDSEERERDSPGYRLFVRQLQTLLGETRLDERIPIGVQTTRSAFTSESVRAFYRQWYRPENLTLVLVGDIGELDPVPLFAKHFESVPRPAAPLPKEPPRGTVSRLAQRLSLHEPEVPSVSLRVTSLVPWVERPVSAARWRAELPLMVARGIVDLRFEERVKQADAPFLSASLGSAEALQVLDGEELSVNCAPEKWKEALAAGEQELRRALQHGFQQAELDEVRANLLRSLHEAVEREATQGSPSLVASVLSAAEECTVPIAAKTLLDVLQPTLDALTVEACQQALVQAWEKGTLAITTLGQLDLGPTPAQALDEAWGASNAVEVEKGAAIEVAEFAYLPVVDAVPAHSTEFAPVADLEFGQFRLDNGVRVNVKRTDFKEKQILFRAVLGEGRLSLGAAEQPLGWMAERVFTDGGLGQHTLDELRRILAGKEVALSFSAGIDSFSFGGATTAADLLLQCAVVCAYLLDAGWREDGIVRVKRELPLMYESMRHQHQGPVVREFMSALFDGDERFTFFAQAKLEAVQLPAVRTWLAPFLAEAPLELSFVGDLDPEAVRAAVAATFGRLPTRRALRPYDEQRKAPTPKSGVHQVHAIETQVQKSLLLVAFPIPDESDVERTWRFGCLTEVLRERLRLEVRERLGAAYSPSAGLQQSRTFPGVGLLLLQAMTEPAGVETLKEACLAVTDALAKDGVKAEEVARLREPILKRLRDARRENGWWLNVMAEAQKRPAVLDEARKQVAYYESITAEQLTELAQTYLARERCSSVIVNPTPQGVEQGK